MNRNLFKRVVVVCLLCACLLTVTVPVTYALNYDSKEKVSGWYCDVCQTSNKIYQYNGVVMDSKPIDNKDGKTHSIALRDEIRCDNPNCPQRGRVIHAFNYRSRNVNHSNSINHSGNNVTIKCSKCSYNRTLSHTAYIQSYGKRLRQDSANFSYKNATYHHLTVYDLYQCNIPGCSTTARKLVNSSDSTHRYHKMTQQLTGRLYQIWDECWDCHHQKNKHTEYR